MSDKEETAPNESRRKFLGAGAAAVAGLGVASGVQFIPLAEAKPADEPVAATNRWGLLIDTSKCATGCDACVTACNTQNGLYKTSHPKTDAQWIRKIGLRDKTSGRSFSLPMMCQHCEYPPCADVCPTGASFRRADGIVLVDRHICIGCRYCMMACPYKARSFVHENLDHQVDYVPRGKGTVEACTLCVQRIDNVGKRLDPACVEACDAEGHKAMVFGDLKDETSEISQQLRQHRSQEIRADLKLNTGVRYRGI